MILLWYTLVKSFFKNLNVSASPTLYVKTTKYPGFLVASRNLKARDKYRIGSNQ
jgi:hypothetical protein